MLVHLILYIVTFTAFHRISWRLCSCQFSNWCTAKSAKGASITFQMRDGSIESSTQHMHTKQTKNICIETYVAPGLHKLWYPTIRDTSTWSKFGAHGEHGDVFLFSNLGALWFSENLIRYSLHICLREVKNNLFSFKHSYLRHFSWRF